jgi:hypothetical protein
LNKTKSSIHEYEDFDRKYEKIELSQKQKREKKTHIDTYKQFFVAMETAIIIITP